MSCRPRTVVVRMYVAMFMEDTFSLGVLRGHIPYRLWTPLALPEHAPVYESPPGLRHALLRLQYSIQGYAYGGDDQLIR